MKTELKPKSDRLQWIENYILEHPHSVNTLDTDFVFAYIEENHASFKPSFFGAPKCPQLAKDLSTLHNEYRVSRVAVGLPSGDAAMGFPKWIYHYSF